jgi:hypothetical protein
MIQMNGVVETNAHLSCTAKRAWDTVCFYEHIQLKPSWFLRTVLPVPMRTTGCYGKVGDESRCMYSDGGYLAKKITNIVAGQRIDFDIIEQSIRYCRSIALNGGTIEVIPTSENTCTARMVTHYAFLSSRLAISRYFVEKTISSMHRIVMRDMEYRLAPNLAARLGPPQLTYEFALALPSTKHLELVRLEREPSFTPAETLNESGK